MATHTCSGYAIDGEIRLGNGGHCWNPPLCRRVRLPAVVGLLLSGVVLGPHVSGFFGEHAPIADFFLSQVAATLAATLVAFDTRNRLGQRLIDGRLLNVVLVLMLTTSILGPIFTERFAPRLLKDATPPDRIKAGGIP